MGAGGGDTRGGGRMSVGGGGEEDKTHARDKMEGAAGALIDHVGIGTFGPHQRNTPIEHPAFVPQACKLIAEVDLPGFQLLESLIAVVAFHGVVAKIAEKEETHGRHEKRLDCGLSTLASRHELGPHPDTDKKRVGRKAVPNNVPDERFRKTG